MNARAFDDIAAVIQRYFDGLYHSDSQLLRSVFHPAALYACATSGSLLTLNMAEYFQVIDQRPSPASRNQVRRDRILSVEFAGEVTAFARVECTIDPKVFVDLLTLVRVDGRWQIIAKIFHFEIAADTPSAYSIPRTIIEEPHP